MGSQLYLPIQVSFSSVHKEIYQKCPHTDHTEMFLRGQFTPTLVSLGGLV